VQQGCQPQVKNRGHPFHGLQGVIEDSMLMMDVDVGFIIIGHERCPNIVVEVKRDESFIYKMVRNFNSMLQKREDVLHRRRDIFSDRRLNIEFKLED
jgi:hypothetical protein